MKTRTDSDADHTGYVVAYTVLMAVIVIGIVAVALLI